MAQTGAVTLIQRFGGALNLNIHFHMLFLDGVYTVGIDELPMRFQQVKAPNREELTRLTHTIARRVSLGNYSDIGVAEKVRFSPDSRTEINATS